jgi:tetratricopeptide (TPR) repeat protein
MSQDSSLNPSQFLDSQLLDKAKKLFEAEQYLQAKAQLEQAQTLTSSETTVGGEIQIWLANSYDALGQTKSAIAICQKLISHSDPVIAKQADYLLSIFSAPAINKLADVTSTLPDLTNLEASNSKSFTASTPIDNTNKAIAPPQLLPVEQNLRKQSLVLRFAIVTFILIFVCSLAIWLYRFT